MVQGVTMGYSEPKKVICRSTGVVVGSNYVPRKLNGQKGVQFYCLRSKQTERMNNEKFALISRVEDCKQGAAMGCNFSNLERVQR